MKIKDILFKIKQDLKSLWVYPGIDAGERFQVDYDRYWKKRRGDLSRSTLSHWQKQRADYVMKFLHRGDRVIDLGCGAGEVLQYLREKVDIEAFGFDINKKAIDELKKKNIKGMRIDITDLDKIKTLPEVDYITGFEIIEHMPNPEEFIHAIKHKARKALIFSFPNTGYYAHRLRLLFGKFPLQWVTHPGEHLRFWTVSDVKWWVENIHFNLDKLIVYEGIPFLNKLIPSLFGKGIIIVISPKNEKRF